MKLRRLSFVKTNLRTRSVHLKTGFIAVLRLKCSVAKVRRGGKAAAAMCGCVRMCAVSVWLQQKRGVFLGGIEARTLLYPLSGLYHSVVIEVGAKVTMPANGTFGVDSQQLPDEERKRFPLCGCAGIGGISFGIQPTFVGNAYAMGVEAPDMGTDAVERAHGVNDAVTGDVEVIAAILKTTLAVFLFQGGRRQAVIASGGGAMNDNKIDTAGTVQAKLRHTVGRHHIKGGGHGLADDCYHNIRV